MKLKITFGKNLAVGIYDNVDNFHIEFYKKTGLWNGFVEYVKYLSTRRITTDTIKIEDIWKVEDGEITIWKKEDDGQ